MLTRRQINIRTGKSSKVTENFDRQTIEKNINSDTRTVIMHQYNADIQADFVQTHGQTGNKEMEHWS